MKKEKEELLKLIKEERIAAKKAREEAVALALAKATSNHADAPKVKRV